MSADEYASKELIAWRQSTNKKELDAIKANELDLISLGNTYVMKSHKGEQVSLLSVMWCIVYRVVNNCTVGDREARTGCSTGNSAKTTRGDAGTRR